MGRSWMIALVMDGLLANPACNVDTMDFANPSPECMQPVMADKRRPDEPDSYIPSVYSRIAFSPSTRGVQDLDLGFYRGNGKILVYSTSKYLVEMANGKFFNSGVHTSEIFVPLYHFMRAGFDFDFVTRDGGAIALEEWTFPMATAADGFPAYENILRETAAKYSKELHNPMRTAEIPKDLSGYVGIFIPGGHGPLVEFHLDTDLGALLRQAHAMELPVMSLCHGPTALRAAALGGEFPFKGYKTKMFPDAVDAWSPSIGYLPGHLKPEDQAESKLVELGMEIMNVELDDSVYQDRELITGASNLGAQKFSELAIPILLAKYQINGTSKKKAHFLDAAFLEYQSAEDMVDEAADARHMLQEVLHQLKKDVDFEKENLEMKEKVVAMWGTRIEQLENLHAKTSATVEKNYAALEAKRTERTVMRSDLMAMRKSATAATVKQDVKKAEKQVVQLQKLQDVIDEMQTLFRADRAERHTVKMNLKRCRGYKKVAVDEVARQRTLISDMTRECTENNAPSKLALLAATDVERKAIRNAGTIRGRMWSTWRKWRRADAKTKKEAVSAKRQARRAFQKGLKAARQDKKQAVQEIQKQTKQIVREGVKDAQKLR